MIQWSYIKEKIAKKFYKYKVIYVYYDDISEDMYNNVETFDSMYDNTKHFIVKAHLTDKATEFERLHTCLVNLNSILQINKNPNYIIIDESCIKKHFYKKDIENIKSSNLKYSIRKLNYNEYMALRCIRDIKSI
jgi:hypothetical protein